MVSSLNCVRSQSGQNLQPNPLTISILDRLGQSVDLEVDVETSLLAWW